MNGRLKACILALLATLWFGTASAMMNSFFPGPGTPASTGSSYTGPGDVVSGAYAWYSCSRGYNAADTANACNVCLPSDTTCADITLTSGFAVVPGSLSTRNITTVICTVKTAYDKSGNGRDVTQATEANRPTFRPAMASNGCPTTALPCMKWNGTSANLFTGSALTQAQPITSSLVYKRGTVTSEPYYWALQAFVYANTFELNAGTALPATAADGSFHAVQGVYNGASSCVYVEGASTCGNAGTNSPGPQFLQWGNASVTNLFDGFAAELGFWAIAFNSTQAGNLNANQHGSNGYNF